MSTLMDIMYLFVELLLEFAIVLFVYSLVSYFQNKFSKNNKWKFSLKKTIDEAWVICLIIALVIVITNHII